MGVVATIAAVVQCVIVSHWCHCRHARQLSNLSNTVIYDGVRTNRENAVDVIEEEPATGTSSLTGKYAPIIHSCAELGLG